jgi:hypothetical protein
MGQDTLSNKSASATEQTNTTGVFSSILDVSPAEGVYLILQNSVPKGTAPGVPIYADLQDSNGDPLPLTTSVVITFQGPNDDKSSVVSERLDNIQPFASRSIGDQQSLDYIDQSKIELLGPRVNVRYYDTLSIEIESSEQIDWSNSKLYIDGDAVTTRSME